MQSSNVDVPGDAGRVEVRHAGGGGGRDGGGGGRTVRPSAAGKQRHECVQGPLPEGGHHFARSQSSTNGPLKIVLAVNHSSPSPILSSFNTLAKNRHLLLRYEILGMVVIVVVLNAFDTSQFSYEFNQYDMFCN